MKLQSCKALVTGGAVRIGRSICKSLATRGCDVVVHCDRSARAAAKLAEHLENEGAHAFVVRGHLGSKKDSERIIAEAWEKAGGLDILVNNAAVFKKDTLMAVNEEEALSQLRTNLLIPIMLTRAFAERVTGAGGPRGKGKVINLLDRRIAGLETGCFSYALSKKMLGEFTRDAALELAPAITVNGVAPGPVLPPPIRDGRTVRDFAGFVPLKRRCTPEDVAAAVIFLLECDAITGQTIFVDGGQHLMGAPQPFLRR